MSVISVIIKTHKRKAGDTRSSKTPPRECVLGPDTPTASPTGYPLLVCRSESLQD
ncbi:hypothetical protein E2C01_085489 [Portunus trituberculatus]|uniref:Uncharacterized protein n=1 Tax=Portunus trituberculatus TaxID=210409 RepID=A0A5B7J148_PORTR|nr:hypothetical protein [Portunus trituberculatus]